MSVHASYASFSKGRDGGSPLSEVRPLEGFEEDIDTRVGAQLHQVTPRAVATTPAFARQLSLLRRTRLTLQSDWPHQRAP